MKKRSFSNMVFTLPRESYIKLIPCKIKVNPNVFWLLLMSMFWLLTGCQHYFSVRSVSPVNAGQIGEFHASEKRFIIHLADSAWILREPMLSGDTLAGIAAESYISPIPHPIRKDRANHYQPLAVPEEKQILDEVHLYLTRMTWLPGNEVHIPLKDIDNIELYEQDKGATTASYAVGISSFITAVGILFFLTKESCPFIYTYTGDDYHFTGEIYSGCIHPPLERHDYLKLPLNNHDDPELFLRIVNEVKEIQHTNLMELLVYDHARNMEIRVDKAGQCHPVCTETAPVRATDFEGNDVLDLVCKADSLYYTSRFSTDKQRITDGVIMEFPNEGVAREADLLIRAKNSFVLDFMIGQFHDQFGDAYHKFVRRQRKAPVDRMIQWTLDQNIPLTLAVERNGTWQNVDYFNIAGPMAMKDDVLQIPLDGTEGNPLRVKLEFGKYLWEIDYAALDCTRDSLIPCRRIPVASAIDQDGKDVSPLLRKDDNRYYDQPSVGDQAVVAFHLPPPSAECRTIYLHTRGWYRILREPSGKPDTEYLRTFREPGAFNRFVNETMIRLF